MVKAVVIRPDNTIRIQSYDGYEGLKKLIPGDLESVPFGVDLDSPKVALFYCDEHGKLNNSPMNALATTIFHQIHPIGLHHFDILFGTIVVIGCVNDSGQIDGEDYDAPDWFIDKIRFLLKE